MTGTTRLLRELGAGDTIHINGGDRYNLYRFAKKLGIMIKVEKCADGFYVTRKNDTEPADLSSPEPIPDDEEPMSAEDVKQANIAQLRMQISGEIQLPIDEPEEVVDEWAGFSEVQRQYDEQTGDHVTFRQHIKTRKIREISRDSFE